MMIPRFREYNPVATAAVGLTLIALFIAVSFEIPTMSFFAGPTYHAEFTDAGDMRAGDEVWVGGVAVGKVTDLDLANGMIVASFTAKDIRLGDQTRAAIKTQTLLGKRVLGLTPAGARPMHAGDTIPVSRTTAPYNIDQELEKVTQQVHDFDKPQMNAALNSFADAFAQTPDGLHKTFVNVAALSRTINTRDQALRELLAHANTVSGVLSQRSGQFESLVTNGNELLGALRDRHEALRRIMRSVGYVTDQIDKFDRENGGQLGPVLHELNGLLDVLRRNDGALQLALSRVGGFIGGIGEGVSSGPSFSANVVGAGVFNYTDLLRAIAAPSAPRVPSAPGIPGGTHLPDPLAGGPGTAAGGPASSPTAGVTHGAGPALPGIPSLIGGK